MYQPQQVEVITEMMRAMEDRQITVLETQNILNAALSFGMPLVFMTALGALVRMFVMEALEEPEEEKVLPVVGAILPETKKKKPAVTVREDIRDSYRGEVFGTLWAQNEAGQKVGRLDFSIYQNEFHIKWIKVPETLRGQGIATSLVDYIKNNYPEKTIIWGMTTPEGTALRRAIEGTSMLPQTQKESKFSLWDCYLDPSNAYAEAKSLRQHNWQVRVTERVTPQGRKYCVWVRKRLPEHLPQTAPIAPATKREELLVRYTGGPQRFAFPEGLEGEIRNFAGHEWVILDTPHNRRVIRESKRWVIARHQPPHLKLPALIPAIPYNAEQIFAQAKQYFGITTNPDEGGYILPDGAMLDFSGKKFGGTLGKRMLDHHDIAFAWPEDDSPGGFEGMKQVMNWGAIRFSTFADTIIVNLVRPPTEAQKRRINLALDYYPDAVLVVEVDDTELTQIC